MRKWLIVASIVLGLGCLAFADIASGIGEHPTASLDVTVSWRVLNWIILYIPADDMSVNLGNVGPDKYNPETNEWTLLESGGHSVYVITSDPDGFELQVSAELVSYPDGHPNPNNILARLAWSSVSLDAKGTLDETVTYTTDSSGLTSASDITYTFKPSFDDIAGDYSVTVTYTVTTL